MLNYTPDNIVFINGKAVLFLSPLFELKNFHDGSTFGLSLHDYLLLQNSLTNLFNNLEDGVYLFVLYYYVGSQENVEFIDSVSYLWYPD